MIEGSAFAAGAPAAGASAIDVSIVVKALNEQDKIAACLESCLAAAAESGLVCEVVLADSLSTDRTVAIASEYPVRIVRLRRTEDRGCGAGVQLGYQHARGAFVYLVDGDMVVQPGFLPAALAELKRDPGLAGVAGLLVDVAVRNAFDRNRVEKGVSMQAREERWLNGGGVYRRAAIEAAGGYAADRNLKGWEEAELGMRVRAAGYRLRRIGMPAVMHEGHSQGTWQLLRGLWRSGRAFASGVLLRQAFGRAWMKDALRLLAHPVGTVVWWTFALVAALVSLGASTTAPLQAWLALTAIATAALVVHKRNLRGAFLSVALWHFWAAGLVVGLLRARVSPARSIESDELASGASTMSEPPAVR